MSWPSSEQTRTSNTLLVAQQGFGCSHYHLRIERETMALMTKVKKRIVLRQVITTSGYQYEVVTTQNTTDYRIRQRLTKDEVESIIAQQIDVKIT
jgi:hypothetical protein